MVYYTLDRLIVIGLLLVWCFVDVHQTAEITKRRRFYGPQESIEIEDDTPNVNVEPITPLSKKTPPSPVDEATPTLKRPPTTTAVEKGAKFDILTAILDVLDERDEDCRQRIACQLGVIRPLSAAVRSLAYGMQIIGKTQTLEQSRYYAPFMGPGKGREIHKRACRQIKCQPSFDFNGSISQWQKSGFREEGLKSVATRLGMYLIKRFIIVGKE